MSWIIQSRQEGEDGRRIGGLWQDVCRITGPDTAEEALKSMLKEEGWEYRAEYQED